MCIFYKKFISSLVFFVRKTFYFSNLQCWPMSSRRRGHVPNFLFLCKFVYKILYVVIAKDALPPFFVLQFFYGIKN